MAFVVEQAGGKGVDGRVRWKNYFVSGFLRLTNAIFFFFLPAVRLLHKKGVPPFDSSSRAAPEAPGFRGFERGHRRAPFLRGRGANNKENLLCLKSFCNTVSNFSPLLLGFAPGT